MSNWLDLSNVSNTLRQTYINGFLDASGPIIGRNDVSFNQKLFVDKDASFGDNIYVKNYVYSATPVASDNSQKLATTAYVQDKLSVLSNTASFVGDVTMVNRLFVYQDVSLGGNFYVLQNTILGGDVSMNTRLYVQKDTSLNANLFVNGDTSLNRQLLVGGDVSMGSRVFIGGDLSVNGNINVNGNVTVPTPISSDNSQKVATTAFVKTALNSLTGASASFAGDVSVNNRLYVGADTSLNGNVYIAKDLLINGHLVVRQYNVQQMITTVSYEVLIAQDLSINGRLFLTNDGSFKNRLFIGSDVSMASRVFIGGDLSVNGNVNMGGLVTAPTPISSDNSQKVATTAYVKSALSSLSGSSASFAGDVSINNRLFIGSDVSFGGNLFINKKVGIGISNPLSSLHVVAGNTTTNGVVYIENPENTTTNYGNELRFIMRTNPTTTFDQGSIRTIRENSVDNYSGSLALHASMNGINGEVMRLTSNKYVGINTTNPTSTLDVSGTIISRGLLTANTGLSVTGTVTLPSSSISDSALSTNITTLTGTQTLTNKTLTSPVISSISNSGTITIPTGTLTLATLTGTETLTNKTITTSGMLTALSDASINGKLNAKELYVSGTTSLNAGQSLNNKLLVLWDNSPNDNVATATNFSGFGINAYTLRYQVQDSSANHVFYANNTELMRISGTSDVSMNGKLFVASDASLGGRLFNVGDVSLNSRLYVGGDTSLNGNVYIAKDLLLNGSLVVRQYNVQQLITTVSYEVLIGRDLSINGRLFLVNDASFQGRLFVVGDVSFNSNVYAKTQTSGDNTNRVATTAFVTSALSAVSGASASFTGDVSINNRLFVGADASFGGNLSVANVLKPTIISEPFTTTNVSASSYTFNYTQGSIFYITAPPSSNFNVNLTNVPTDISRTYLATFILSSTVNKTFCSSIQINGNTAIIPNFANGLPLASQLGAMNTQSVIIQRVSAGDVSSNVNVFSSVTPYLTSTSNSMFMNYSDASFGSRVFISGDVSINNRLFVGSDASFGNRVFVTGNLSVSGNITGTFPNGSIPSSAIIGGVGSSNFTTDVSINQRLIVLGDTSFNSRLFVGSDASMGGNLAITKNISVNGIVFQF